MTQLTVFADDALLLSGDAESVRAAIVAYKEKDATARMLAFDDATGKQVDVDLRASTAEAAPRGRGRPRLGVQAREVTLLPRHWDWLAAQPGGASVALRRLVEMAAKQAGPRAAQDRCYHFMMAMAGDQPRYEEALRALYASEEQVFATAIADWPAAIRDHAKTLADGAFA